MLNQSWQSGQTGHVTEHNTIASRIVNVKDYGAKGDQVTDDTASINAAIQAISAHNTLYFPHGYYLLKGSGTELLLINKALRIVGETSATTLLVDSTVGETTDIIRVDIAGTVRNLSIQNLTILPNSGTPGQHGINIDVTDAGQQIAELLISRVHIYAVGGKSINLTNPTATAAFYHSWIEKCVLYKGIYLERCGDNVSISDNIITGAGIGIEVSTEVGGVSQLLISHNNITSKGGAIKLTSGDQTKIVYNQIEVPDGFTGSSLVDIAGNETTPLIMATIADNNINGNCDKDPMATNLISLGYTIDAIIRDNNLQKGSVDSVVVTANAVDTRIDHNHWGHPEISPSISDAGTNTWTLP